jgi:hypothetical protein
VFPVPLLDREFAWLSYNLTGQAKNPLSGVNIADANYGVSEWTSDPLNFLSKQHW